MISAKRSDKPLVTDLLSAAFNDNSSVNYIVRQDDKHKAWIRALMVVENSARKEFGFRSIGEINFSIFNTDLGDIYLKECEILVFLR